MESAGNADAAVAAPGSAPGILAMPPDPALVDDRAYDSLLASLEPIRQPPPPDPPHPSQRRAREDPPPPGLMRTENLGITHASSASPLVDLFFELEGAADGARLATLLDAAWAVDPERTWRVAWHARSVGRGKGERAAWYRCLGWAVERGHWLTVLRNLPLAVEPVDRRGSAVRGGQRAGAEAEGGADAAEAAVLIDAAGNAELERELDADTARAHGYYKDLANLVVLSAVGELRCSGDLSILPGLDGTGARRDAAWSCKQGKRYAEAAKRLANERDEASVPKGKEPVGSGTTEEEKRARKEWYARSGPGRAAGAQKGLGTLYTKDASTAKALAAIRRSDELARCDRVREAYGDPGASAAPTFHRALHITVARLFAKQLHADAGALARGKQLGCQGPGVKAEARRALRSVGMAAKWAPTPGKFHDRYAFLAPSIAEALAPAPIGTAPTAAARAAAERHYRKMYLSPLRAHVEVVERKLSAQQWSSIRFSRVPSQAMAANAKHFRHRAPQEFGEYLERVAKGIARISGASLTPASLVHRAIQPGSQVRAERQLIEGQWKALVAGVQESGEALEGSLAVIDVSGSMDFPRFKDGTCPRDHAVGLGLVLATVTAAPWRGRFLTFHSRPEFYALPDLDRVGFVDVVAQVLRAPWGGSTDFIGTFRVILRRAQDDGLKPEDMIKRLFVFSDMEFDKADDCNSNSDKNSGDDGASDYRTHHQIIKQEYADAGYELPELVYWNLAGGRTGHPSKPVTVDDAGTALVSGYSAALVKMFLEGGKFEAEDEEMAGWAAVAVEGEEEDDVEVGPVKKEVGMDPLLVVDRAIGHESFRALRVYD